jgi:tetratricopeptide (TPR) repeat protein
MGPERAREQARKFWQDRYEDLEIASAEILVDKTRGEVRIETTGKLDLEWSDGTPRSHVVMGSQLGVNLTPKRTAGPFADAPVAVREQFEKTEVTLVLPSPGFVMTGDPIDTAIAGIRYVRRQALTGNRLTMTAETRAMAHEISLAEAKAADVATDTLWDRKLRVKAPEKAVKDKAVGKTVRKTAPPKTAAKAVPQPAAPAGVDSPPSPAAQALFAAAGQKTQDGAYDEALALLDGAGPEVPRDTAWTVMRVLVLLEAGRTKEADRVSETALAKAPRDPALLKLRAQVLEKNGRYDDALILLDRLTVLEPDNAKTFAARGDVRRKLQDYEGAIADYDVALQLQPQDEQRQFDRINVYIARRDWPGAMKASDAALAVFPDSELLHATRAFVLVKLDRGPEARAALERSLAIEPNANAYALRSFHGLSDGPQTEISDWEAVIRLEPGRAMTPALAKRLVAAGGYDRLAAAYQAAHAKAPTDGDIIVAASVLHDAGDKPDATLLMLDTAMALDQKSAELFNESCWIRATRRMDLAKALAACDAALALKPKQSAYLDSRGLVRLQMGQYDKALADYDASLADEPGQTTSMYGRGLARMMLKQPGWEADIAAARKGNDGVDADYASFKLPFALPLAPPVAKATAK